MLYQITEYLCGWASEMDLSFNINDATSSSIEILEGPLSRPRLQSNTSDSTYASSSSSSENDTNILNEHGSKRYRHNIDLYQLFGDAPSDQNSESATSGSDLRMCIQNELKAYKEMKVPSVEYYLDMDVLLWWRDNALKLPILSHFARFIHSIPASSLPSERCFSVAGNIYTAKRNRLKPSTLNSMLTLKSNWDIINPSIANPK